MPIDTPASSLDSELLGHRPAQFAAFAIDVRENTDRIVISGHDSRQVCRSPDNIVTRESELFPTSDDIVVIGVSENDRLSRRQRSQTFAALFRCYGQFAFGIANGDCPSLQNSQRHSSIGLWLNETKDSWQREIMRHSIGAAAAAAAGFLDSPKMRRWLRHSATVQVEWL